VSNDDPFRYTSGPRQARAIIVGEAWGAEEERARSPFVGYSGQELDRILYEAGLLRSQILCTNIVDARPPANDFTAFLLPTKEYKGERTKGLCLTPVVSNGLSKLRLLIDQVKPELIIGAGNYPLWALTEGRAEPTTKKGKKIPSGIMSWRGSQIYTEQINGRSYPYLPIIHPAAITREWSYRRPTIHDLKARAARFLSGRTSWEEPKYDFDHAPSFERTIAKLRDWIAAADQKTIRICVDLETYLQRWIACVGLADDRSAICIPFFFFDTRGAVIDYWAGDQEVEITFHLKRLLEHRNAQVVNQNIIYDYQFLRRGLNITIRPYFDSMLAHHLLWPGTPKALEYIASLYCDHYIYWKDESQDWNTGLKHEDLWKYNCKDVRYTYDAILVLESLLEQLKLTEQFRFQMEQWELARSIMDRGTNYNHALAGSYRNDLKAFISALERDLTEMMPENTRYASGAKSTPWFNSPKLLMDILYRQLGLDPVLHKKTKQPTTDSEALVKLRDKYVWLRPLFVRIEALRSARVLLSHSLSPTFPPDNRLKASFNVGGTSTFRWSSSSNAFDEGMNLQNLTEGD